MPPTAARHLALYARVSTTHQSSAAQLGPLREYASRRALPAVEYVDDGVSGRKASRPALNRLLAACRRREVAAVVVVRLDRLARSLAHLAKLGEELQALGVELCSLSESIDTSSPTGRALFGMCGVFAQLEADLIRERTLAGLAVARRRGKRFGRPPAVYPPQLLARVRRLRQAGHSFRHIAELLEVSVGKAHKLARLSA